MEPQFTKQAVQLTFSGDGGGVTGGAGCGALELGLHAVTVAAQPIAALIFKKLLRFIQKTLLYSA
ncbi:hypothetical protein GCM10007895_23710 [Paraferrimonas sedimenticola]|uniref:Uncharacterized protein n=1 Tax=Paraferrimonas sedimenticola TaxID=375674 RepID=A0AA37RXR3_9GAMM|nr:hypothetical protein GCM10007895_23710 [Paraferrimonas sedimenticola]